MGLDAILTTEGRPHDVPAAVARTAYRIVQEALTNTARHACATTANVRIEYRTDTLTVQVDDDGKATPDDAPAPGLGLLGMRERVIMIRVLLADDQPLIRSGFRALLDLEDDFEVIAEAADGEEGLALIKEHLLDVALIDIQMPVMGGIEATRHIAADPALTDVHVVILTNYGTDEYVLHDLRAGAAGFLAKDIVPEDLLHTVRVAARGDALLTPSTIRKLIHRYLTQPPPATGTALKALTSREREGVTLAARALSNDQIADHMAISPMTAKTHINRAMTKLHARDRAQLDVLAYQSGLVSPGTG